MLFKKGKGEDVSYLEFITFGPTYLDITSQTSDFWSYVKIKNKTKGEAQCKHQE